jgi:hypothetical protein
MDDFDDFPTFLGRAGNLYGKKNLSPPFRLKEFAEAWVMEGISLSHCIEQISIHLNENSSRYRCGSGDGGLASLDVEIRQSWHLGQRSLLVSSQSTRLDREASPGMSPVIPAKCALPQDPPQVGRIRRLTQSNLLA